MSDIRDLLTKLDEVTDQFINNNVQEDDDAGNDPDTGEVKVGDYETRHFDMCPAATAVYKDIEANEMTVRSAKLQDVLYYMEKDPDRAHVPEDAVMAQIVANEIMNIADAMDMTEEHNYIQGHVDAIEEKVGKE
tara:strand:- start:249 stop:650 length:402 start_codon:yes stop_codon:yes gene_type:complete